MLNKNFTSFPVLTTQRLTLRQPGLNDEKEIFTLRSDSEVHKYLDRKIAETMDDARNFIMKVNQSINNNDALYWAITFSDKNILVGTICLFNFSDEHNKSEIGYELLTNFQGHGIMTEAVEKVIDYAFYTIKVKKIEAFVHNNNLRSIKLLERFSFMCVNIPDKTDADLTYYQLIHPTEGRK